MTTLLNHSISLRRIVFGLWIASIPLLILLLLCPINSRPIRCTILLLLFAVLAGSFFFAWKNRILFLSLLSVFLGIGLFLILPGHPPSELSSLQAPYTKALSNYENIPYVWGGESRFGMDCSGLIRKSFQDVLLKHGIFTLNPFLVRGAIDLWWNDTTAKEIGKGYERRTVHILNCASLNTVDSTALQPGDIAVTASGVHVMAYLGNNRWIGADPGEKRVTIFSIPEPRNPYFSSSMNIMRWNKVHGEL